MIIKMEWDTLYKLIKSREDEIAQQERMIKALNLQVKFLERAEKERRRDEAEELANMDLQTFLTLNTDNEING